MRHIIVLSLFCLLVCSCEKTQSLQTRFVGNWEVVIKCTESTVGVSSQTTREEAGWIYTFDVDGNGTRIKDTGVNTFHYQYDMDSKTITITEGCTIFTYDVEVLTENAFQFKAVSETKQKREVVTYIGKKIRVFYSASSSPK